MERRKFLQSAAMSGIAATYLPLAGFMRGPKPEAGRKSGQPGEYSASLVVAGGGLGGCAAALAALRNGLTVMLAEFQDFIRSQGIETRCKF